jgi:hypothetical protein
VLWALATVNFHICNGNKVAPGAIAIAEVVPSIFVIVNVEFDVVAFVFTNKRPL